MLNFARKIGGLMGVQIPQWEGEFWRGRACTNMPDDWRELFKNGWTDRDAFLVMGLRNHVLDGGPYPSCEEAIFRGNINMPRCAWWHSAVSCAKMAKQIEITIWLWTRVHWRKHVLHGGHIGAIWRIRLNRPYAAAMQPCQITLTTYYRIILNVRRHSASQRV